MFYLSVDPSSLLDLDPLIVSKFWINLLFSFIIGLIIGGSAVFLFLKKERDLLEKEKQLLIDRKKGYETLETELKNTKEELDKLKSQLTDNPHYWLGLKKDNQDNYDDEALLEYSIHDK